MLHMSDTGRQRPKSYRETHLSGHSNLYWLSQLRKVCGVEGLEDCKLRTGKEVAVVPFKKSQPAICLDPLR
jgi:hypothetical protein